MNFSQFIASAMKDQDITRGELADQMEISKSYLSNLMNGRKRWNEESIKSALDALGWEMDFKLKKRAV